MHNVRRGYGPGSAQVSAAPAARPIPPTSAGAVVTLLVTIYRVSKVGVPGGLIDNCACPRGPPCASRAFGNPGGPPAGVRAATSKGSDPVAYSFDFDIGEVADGNHLIVRSIFPDG